MLFGTVCRLRPEKNISFLLRTFARAELPDARLAIVGDGPMRGRWETLASQLGIADRVTFASVTDDPASCYAALDVFVMSSTTEQMPNALLEAMACGLPAICTDVGDSREMLGNAGPPAVVPRGDDAYTAALTTIAGSGELRARLGAANRARCVEHYSLDRMVLQVSEVYDAAIRSARRRPDTD
jgi:glycosyltransferase involved in cell wall biosynthesis